MSNIRLNIGGVDLWIPEGRAGLYTHDSDIIGAEWPPCRSRATGGSAASAGF